MVTCLLRDTHGPALSIFYRPVLAATVHPEVFAGLGVSSLARKHEASDIPGQQGRNQRLP